VDLSQAVQDLFNDIQTTAQIIAPVAAIIGFIGLGIMYLGSSWPIIGQWKQDNPRAANQVIVGLFFIVFASSVTALISFS
jgi:phage-related minor tail protein